MFDKISSARKLLDIPETATYSYIKERYIALSKCHHPDIHGSGEKMREINEAYEVICDYIDHYAYSFAKKDIINAYPELLYRRFYEDQK
ncbi:MAG: J domain-containing protein [Epsilonproteobacteria bacterium]|nr:J domain-containing protein [Campylobacterota bacterium]